MFVRLPDNVRMRLNDKSLFRFQHAIVDLAYFGVPSILAFCGRWTILHLRLWKFVYVDRLFDTCSRRGDKKSR